MRGPLQFSSDWDLNNPKTGDQVSHEAIPFFGFPGRNRLECSRVVGWRPLVGGRTDTKGCGVGAKNVQRNEDGRE